MNTNTMNANNQTYQLIFGVLVC